MNFTSAANRAVKRAGGAAGGDIGNTSVSPRGLVSESLTLFSEEEKLFK